MFASKLKNEENHHIAPTGVGLIPLSKGGDARKGLTSQFAVAWLLGVGGFMCSGHVIVGWC